SRVQSAQRGFTHFLIYENAGKRNSFHLTLGEMFTHVPLCADASVASTTLTASKPAHPSTGEGVRFSIETINAANSTRTGSSCGNSSCCIVPSSALMSPFSATCRFSNVLILYCATLQSHTAEESVPTTVSSRNFPGA